MNQKSLNMSLNQQKVDENVFGSLLIPKKFSW